jgi:DNA-binding beta-propeller fold protein YncE
MEIKTAFKIGKPTPSSWSGVFGNRPEDRLGQHKYGEMFAVLSLSADMEFEAQRVGGLLFDQLQAAYFSPEAEEVDIMHFERALLSIRERVAEILEREPELAEVGLDIELATVAIRGEVMYVGVVGESRIMVCRDEDFAEISGALIDPEADGFLRSGSLFVQSDDRIALATSKAYDQHTNRSWKDALVGFNVDELHHDQGAAILVGNNIKSTPKLEPIVAAVPEAISDIAGAEIDLNENVAEDFAVTQPMVNSEMAGDEILETDLVDDADIDPENYDDEEDVEVADEPKWKTMMAEARTRSEGAWQSIKAAVMMRREKLPDDEETEEDTDLEFEAELDDEWEAAPVPRERMMNAARNLRETGAGRRAGDAIARLRSYDYSGLMGKIRFYASTAWKRLQAIFFTLDELVSRVMGKQTYGRGRRAPNTKFWLVVLVVAVALIFFGIRSAINESERAGRVQAISTEIASYESQLTQLSVRADTVSLSTAASADKEKVINDLTKLASSVRSTSQKPEATNDQKDKLTVITTTINTKLDAVTGVRAFTQPQVVTDLATYFSNANPVDLQFASGQVYIVDKARGVVYRADPNINAEPGEFVSGLISPYLITATPEGDLVIADQNADSAIATLDAETKNVKRHPGLSLSRMGTLLAMFVWDNNGALYNINGVKQSIFKQESIAGNFQLPNDGAPWRLDADLAQAGDIYVDGSIYVLVKGKGLVRYFGGEPATLEINGLLSSDLNALQDSDAFEMVGDELFIADSSGKRVLKFKRNPDAGEAVFEFVEQYVYKGSEAIFSNIRDISFQADSRKLFVLDGAKVIRLDV